MKVKIFKRTLIEEEVEINNENLERLDNFWNTNVPEEWKNCPAEWLNEAVAAVEEATGVPFGDEDAETTVVAVQDMNGNPILEW